MKPTPGNPPPAACDAAPPVTRSDADMMTRLVAIESLLATLVEQRTVKEWYSTAEVARLVGKAEFTVREWCRLGRVEARKRRCGRGPAGEWAISHAELTRVMNHGLLPSGELTRGLG